MLRCLGTHRVSHMRCRQSIAEVASGQFDDDIQVFCRLEMTKERPEEACAHHGIDGRAPSAGHADGSSFEMQKRKRELALWREEGGYPC